MNQLKRRRLPNLRQNDCSKNRQSGVGLIEVMVATVILSIGFLATARMQMASMQYGQSAYFDSQAYFMAGEIIARMRANAEGVRAGNYDALITSAGLSNPGCTSKLCTPDELAAQDAYDWSQYLHGANGQNSVTALLPSSDTVDAQGSVTRLATGAYSVRIAWADESDSADGQSSLRVDLFLEN